jgi:alkylation response protein AidB-like acyl-CoA dehydrogenase
MSTPVPYTPVPYTESEERRALREAVGALANDFGRDWFLDKVRSGESTHELWEAAGKHGYLGVAVPEEYGGGGGGIGDLAAVSEELATAGCPLLMMVVSPAICATVIARFGTDEQRADWLPRFAEGSVTMAFSITEPDAGSNSHRITTTARRDGADWILNGGKTFISGVDHADAVLVVARTEDARTGRLKPCLFIVPTDAAGFTRQPIPMDIVSPDRQFTLWFDDVRLPESALVGDEDAGLQQLFAGLNPERIMVAAFATGIGRFAIGRATAYARDRSVFDAPIGSHQAVAHPLAQAHIELELARLMTQKAAAIYDAGDPAPSDSEAAGEAANMAKYAAGEACCHAVDAAVQTHGGNGLASEYGLGGLLAVARTTRIAPVSREMILNFVAQHGLGLPKSY